MLLLVGGVGRAGLRCKRLDRLGASLALTPYPGHEEADKEVQIRRCRSKMWSFPEAVAMVGSWVDALIEEAARAPLVRDQGCGCERSRGRPGLREPVERREKAVGEGGVVVESRSRLSTAHLPGFVLT